MELLQTKSLSYLGEENLKNLNPEAIVSISMGDAYFVYPHPEGPAIFKTTDYRFKAKLNPTMNSHLFQKPR